MLLIESQIDLTKTATSSMNNLDEQASAPNQISFCDVASDGAFLELDSDGQVKLFEIKVDDLDNTTGMPTFNMAAPDNGAKESSDSNRSQVVGSYQRPDITLYDRLQIAACFWHPERAWGTVTELARKYGTSRETIYQIAYKAKRGLSARQPGPKCQPPQIIGYSNYAPEADHATGVDAEKDNVRERIILTSLFPGGVTMRPLEEILNEIPCINSGSDTTIWRIVNQAGKSADQILSEVDYQQINLPLVFVAIDETFFNGYPIFLVVEPISLAICAYYIPPDKDRSADNWSCVLELLKKEQNLNIIGGLGDAAKAYPKAFQELLGNEENFCEDIFHLLYAIKRLAIRLERQAYSALNQVNNLEEKLNQGKVKVEKVEQAGEEANQKIYIYDEFDQIANWISDGLEMVDFLSGEVRDREINEWLLDVAIKEMEKLEHDEIKKMAKRLKNHKKKLLKHLDWLNNYLCEPMDQLHQYLDDKELEGYIMNLVARYWRVNHACEGLKYRTLRPLAEKLRKEIEFWTTGDQWMSNWTMKLFQLFSSIQRTFLIIRKYQQYFKANDQG